ncbi:MAG: ATP-binding cassette domain-containing protein [Magnetococcales bacterium]|nr:ATP-binding cassette domain-containing protein [Magnetococcales bacterium]MBF0632255.1 ATP-binding cassette domain-containing protein [Magnetococcales bacterium]
MSEEILIRGENVYKKFCLDLKRSLWYGLTDVGRELTGKKRPPELRRDEFWAIHDVSFSIKRGDIVGLIGPNGSGKTTLLRLINGLIKPDRGRISIRGRVGALIQLGAGFSPILTGRENIYINAAILGLSRQEINSRMDEIIEFADIGEFINTPVRNYSSGMRARLGFAVAIHMSPDILLVDEVLSVGDMVFRNKALDRMHKLATSGVAVIFVSHNLSQVDRLCTSAMYLKKGVLQRVGSTMEVISHYSSTNIGAHEKGIIHHPGSQEYIWIQEAQLINAQGELNGIIRNNEAFTLRLIMEVRQFLQHPHFSFMAEPFHGYITAALFSMPANFDHRPSMAPGQHTIDLNVSHLPLMPGPYRLRLSVTGNDNNQLWGRITNLATLIVSPRFDSLETTGDSTIWTLVPTQLHQITTSANSFDRP